MAGKELKGWFKAPGRDGDRTLDQQLKGLDYLLDKVCAVRKTVLDVGCAEGLISHTLFDHGAVAVHGIEIVPRHVEAANRLCGERACTFEVADANTYTPVRRYDIVLMLAVLHKLRDPTKACLRFATAARETVVLRLPPAYAPRILDARSGNRVHDMGAVMEAAGFELTHVDRGHFEEWVGIYRRMSHG